MSLYPVTKSTLVTFRKELHKNPELSGYEKRTSQAIVNFIAPTNPTKIITNIGGYGVAAVYDSGLPGPTVLFRADMDALPIQESNQFPHRSSSKGVAHLCGHDGHATILAGFSYSLLKNPPPKGKVVLLFQPAEETGEGAARVIADTLFSEIKPSYAFGLHNLPGFEQGTFFVRDGAFASASKGMVIELKGLPSHAAHPEDGNNPDQALAQLILGLNSLVPANNQFSNFTLVTVIHAKLGEVAFGTTPGNAVVMATLRSFENPDMDTLTLLAEKLVHSVCTQYGISYKVSYQEEFPATTNSAQCVNMVRAACQQLNLPLMELDSPFRWSEDFGHFSKLCSTAFFGVGAGVNHPQLHNENYDFPDDIIPKAIQVFEAILNQLLVNTK
ncbi:MAG: amidohydrolase [Bacteroidales bacterium]|nr:amidohydrolase [Bacteroidales bacterium]MBN2750334.1 amidohydrolase [Bacteroidales bacterium]